MKKIITSLFLGTALLFAGNISAQTFDFSNIQYWIGSGTNESALVVSWNDGKTPDNLTWGYKWNTPTSGTNPTMLTMMQAIQSADSRFLFTPHPLYDTPPADYAIYSVFFDLTGSGGTPVVGLPKNMGGTENGSPPYPGDHYREGWKINGDWGLLTGSGNPNNGGSWVDASTGVGEIALSNSSWYGLSFSTDPNYPYPIPNPGFPNAVSIPPLTFLQWQVENGATGGATATPLNDGVPNLLKFLFDINPSQPMSASDRAALPVPGMTTTSGTQYLTLTYRQNQNLASTTVRVQTSPDLQTWSTITPNITQQTGTDPITGDPIVEVEVQATGASRNFLRLNVIAQ